MKESKVCPKCKGAGVIPEHGYEIGCSKCEGDGVIEIDTPPIHSDPAGEEKKTMNPYGKHEQEQALGAFIHEHNRGLSVLTRKNREMTDWIHANVDALKSVGIDIKEIYRFADAFKGSEGLLRKFMDDYITRWKKFPIPTSTSQTGRTYTEREVCLLLEILDRDNWWLHDVTREWSNDNETIPSTKDLIDHILKQNPKP